MRKQCVLFLLVIVSCIELRAQVKRLDFGGPIFPVGNTQGSVDLNKMATTFFVSVNPMDPERKNKLNGVADRYRNKTRSSFGDVSKAMLTGGVGAIVSVLGNEVANLLKIRSKQKKAWQEMRNKECLFIDSLESVIGQSDFYGDLSSHGPLDPSNMNFDGITLRAQRDGQDVLKMVCHIDTARLNHMFMHSKFYLVVDTILFNPYRSFLPNFQALHVDRHTMRDMDQVVRDYWQTISQFDFNEYGSPVVNISMDICSSWINEMVQVNKDVKLGGFSVNIPIDEKELRDSIYVYYRSEALENGLNVIDMEGDCFVVPRSYMPVDATNPSWGTGEYKMKVTISEKCRYNTQGGRAKNWHRDYKQLVRMQNHGKAKNEYWEHVISAVCDNKVAILKATYTPFVTHVSSKLGIGASAAGGMGGGAQAAAMQAAMKSAMGAMSPGKAMSGASPALQNEPVQPENIP